MHQRLCNRGFSLVEIIVSVAIVVTVITAVAGAWQLYFRALHATTYQAQASLITEEASEAINFLRDQSWSTNIESLSLESRYFLTWNGSSYGLVPTRTEFRNGYVAEIGFSSVLRDSNGNIVNGGGTGTVDSRTLIAQITISPLGDPSKSLMSSEMLIHDYFNN